MVSSSPRATQVGVDVAQDGLRAIPWAQLIAVDALDNHRQRLLVIVQLSPHLRRRFDGGTGFVAFAIITASIKTKVQAPVTAIATVFAVNIFTDAANLLQ